MLDLDARSCWRLRRALALTCACRIGARRREAASADAGRGLPPRHAARRLLGQREIRRRARLLGRQAALDPRRRADRGAGLVHRAAAADTRWTASCGPAAAASRTRCRPCAARRRSTPPGARSASWCSTCPPRPATSRPAWRPCASCCRSPMRPGSCAVPQQRATTHEALQALLDKTVRMGGEGLMLHRGGSPYRSRTQRRPAQGQALRRCRRARRRAHRAGQRQARRPPGRADGRDARRQALQARQRLQRRRTRESARDRHLGQLPLQRHRTPRGLPRFARFLRVRDEHGFVSHRGPCHFGSSTLSTTWITPFDWITSAVVTFAVLPFSSVDHHLAAARLGGERAAGHGLQRGHALAGHDLLRQRRGVELAGHDVVGQDGRQLAPCSPASAACRPCHRAAPRRPRWSARTP